MSALPFRPPPRRDDHIDPPQELLERLTDLTNRMPTSEDRLDTIQLFMRLFDIRHNDFPTTIYEQASLLAQAARLTERNRLGFEVFAMDWLNPALVRNEPWARPERQQQARGEAGAVPMPMFDSPLLRAQMAWLMAEDAALRAAYEAGDRSLSQMRDVVGPGGLTSAMYAGLEGGSSEEDDEEDTNEEDMDEEDTDDEYTDEEYMDEEDTDEEYTDWEIPSWTGWRNRML